jgi:hypothetical protein
MVAEVDRLVVSEVGPLVAAAVGHLAVAGVGHLAAAEVGHLAAAEVGRLVAAEVGRLGAAEVGCLVTAEVGCLAAAEGVVETSPREHHWMAVSVYWNPVEREHRWEKNHCERGQLDRCRPNEAEPLWQQPLSTPDVVSALLQLEER